MNFRTRIGLALLIAMALFAHVEAAAQLREPARIPEGAAVQEQAMLGRQRVALVAELDALRARIAEHNQKCGQVPTDSPLVGECRANQGRLRAEVEHYRNGLAEYDSAVGRMNLPSR